MRYRDLDGAIDWLCAAFDFTPHKIVRDDIGRTTTAQLRHGTGMIMLAPVGESAFDELMRQPDEIGGAETQSCYFVVGDSDRHCERARSQGATIVIEPQDFEHGGRGYLCRDPEGHLWSFGTFDPWSSVGRASQPPLADAWRWISDRLTPRQLAMSGGLLIATVLCGLTTIAMWPASAPVSDTLGIANMEQERIARIDAERRASQAEQALARLRQDKDATELDSDKLQEELAHLSGAKDTAEAQKKSADIAVQKLAADVSQLQLAKVAAERSVRQLTARSVAERQMRERIRRRLAGFEAAVSSERAAKQRSDRALAELQGRLDKEIVAKQAAEAARSRTEGLLVTERQARLEADAALQRAVEHLRQGQALQPSTGSSPAVSPTPVAPIEPPRPAKRPAKKPPSAAEAGPKGGAGPP